MRIEEQAIYDRAEAIKSAGRHMAARCAVMIETMEREGHFDARRDDEDWSLAEAMIEAASVSPHFIKKHGNDLFAYALFHAAAKLEFFGVFNLYAHSRSVTKEEDAYHEEHWASKIPELEASELRVARAG